MTHNIISEERAIAAEQSVKEHNYWLEKFSGEPARVHFHYDRPKSARTDGFDTHSFQFPATTAARLTQLSSGSEYVLHMVLVSGVVLLLNKYTFSQDIIIGTTIDKQDEDGDFINSVLALRNSIREGMTFKDLLMQVRQTVVEANENQNYPIESLVYDLKLYFDKKEFPLFDVAVLLENIHDIRYLQNIKPALTFAFRKGDGQVTGTIHYNFSVYKKSTVERIAMHLNVLMADAIFNVDQTLPEIRVLTDWEKNLLLRTFNNDGQVFSEAELLSPGACIHKLFEQQVALTPGNTALIFDDQTNRQQHALTYRQLNEISSRIAAALQSKYVAPGTIVGLMAERSLEMIAAMLGIMKAGAAYLPIDPESPSERIKYILKDSSAALLLVNVKKYRPGPIAFKGETVDIDEIMQEEGTTAAGPSEGSRDNAAYVIYTSGSTGKPKGVVVEHRGIANTLIWRKKYYHFGSSDVILQIPSFAFDSSVEDIFTPLISGSTLVLVEQENRRDVRYLIKLIRDVKVSHFLIVPNFYRAFLEDVSEELKSLKTITVAGDHFTHELVDAHFEKLPAVQLFNEYGPTENSVCSTVYQFEPGKNAILIGKPIHNVQCYILDARQRLAPLGVPGELCVAGMGLARGYLNRPELTGEKFKENLTAMSHHVHRLYCTGDVARWTEDGNLEFDGRSDNQVKIRGFRIEPGEIEACLKELDSIDEAVVVAKDDSRGQKFLCAYLEIKKEVEMPIILNYLMQKLPNYMIPAHFVQLEQLPLNANGKIDRKNLTARDETLHSCMDYFPPDNRIQEKLVELWQKGLGVERIGIKDNYFNIGGDSIKSIGLMNAVNQEFNTDLKILDLYVNNTIEKLSYLLGRDNTGSRDNDDSARKEMDNFRSSILGGE